jgi:YVTN family beta-propeller protein
LPAIGAAFRLHFTPDGKRVLASDLPNGEVVVIDVASRKEEKRIQVAQAPIGMVVTPDSRRAFVACQGGGKVFAIDLEKLAITGNIDAGAAPDGVCWAEPRTPKPTRNGAPNPPAPGGALAPAVQHLQNRLQQHLATHVVLHHSDKRGRIEIEYYGNDDLQRLLVLLGLPPEEQ